MPGVQKPHCKPPAAIKLSAKASRSSSVKPSSVTTDFPATELAGTAHDTTALPSTITVQHSHCPCGLQSSLGEIKPHEPRRTSSNDAPSSTSTARSDEFRLNVIRFGMLPP